jgi:hypothetical protein
MRMSSERAARSEPGAKAEDESWYDYYPSAKLSLRDELRLLDESLDEARARPRPPALAIAPSLPAVAHRPLGHVSGQVAVVSARLREQMNGHKLSSPQVNGHRLSAEHHQANGHQLAAEDGQVNGQQLSGEEPEVERHRVTTHNLLDPDDEAMVDRKRLLAAIICILQEELTRSK